MKKSKRDYSTEANRRQYPRLKPSAVPFLKSVTFNQGYEAQVVNISRGGILLETEVRLRPQMKIFLKFITSDGIVRMEGQILRSSISSLDGPPRYRSAIAFDHPFLMLDDLSADVEGVKEENLRESPDLSEPGKDSELPPMDTKTFGPTDGEPAVLTLVAQEGTSMQDMFKLNDW